jgi:hypothetical protein
MPLRDHFRPPISQQRSWGEIHAQWPAVIVQQLGQLLPPQYSAGPRVHLGSEIEIDVATFVSEPAVATYGATEPQTTAVPPLWQPGEPTLTVETDLADFDEYQVRVYDMRRGRRLVAVIELISPANKDRPEHRQQFTAKCAALLRQGVSVMLVDVVTVRDANLYASLLQLIGQRDPSLGERPPGTYAVACRWNPRGASRRLQVWYHSLAPGAPLPCLPLWLADELAIPLDLEASYEQTCRDLRIS